MNSGKRKTQSTAETAQMTGKDNKTEEAQRASLPTPKADGPTLIDLDGILRRRLPAKVSRFLPRFATGWLEKVVCQDRLNELLEAGWPAEGSEFASRVLDEMGITLEVVEEERVPSGARVVFASNHPLGGLDGIALIKVLGERYGDEKVRFLVNDLLMNVEPLRPVFLPINKYGSQGRAAAAAINAAYASDAQILVFPAGLVSRLGEGGKIADLKWQKAFVAKAIEYGRDIVPVRFEGLNSMRFYRTARVRSRLGLKVNIEQALLPSELCRAEGKRFRIIFGEPIPNERLRADRRSTTEIAASIREMIVNRDL